jgi:HPt (histidine-containing phosphotransfer) domain-containing protein
MDDYLSKPFKRESLGAVLARWLARAGSVATTSMAIDRAAAPTFPNERSATRAATAPGTSATPQTLNADALKQLRDVFDGDISGVVGAWLSDAQTQINAMQSAFDREVDVELARAAHSLKSTSRSVGADALASVCAEIETIALSEGCPPRAIPLLRKVREQFAAAEAALNAERAAPARIPAA